MLLLLETLVRPARTACQIKSAPRWILPFLVLSALSVVALLLTHSASVELAVEHLPQSATPEDKTAVRNMLAADLAIEALFLPVRLLAGWSSFAVMMFYACNVLASEVPVYFKQVLSVEVAAESPIVLGTLVGSLVWAPSSADVVPTPLSLAFLSKTDSGLLSNLFLGAVSPFSVWHVVILGFGIRELAGTSSVRAFSTASVLWAVSVMLNAGVIHLISSTMKFHL